MLRIADIIRRIVLENPLYAFGLQQRLFNLTQLSKYMQPLIETRTKKPVQPSAILMALSRIQKQMGRPTLQRTQFEIEGLTIHSDLVTLTYPKTTEVQRAIQDMHASLREQGEYLTITEGTKQVTVIVENASATKLKKRIKVDPLFEHRNITSIGISFDKKFIQFPGMLYILIQQFTLQNINIIEISSTFTELVVYIDQVDTRTAFDTIYTLFAKKE